MIVQSSGQLQALTPQFRTYSDGGGANAWPGHESAGYGDIYASDPNIRIPTDFLAGNVAQLGIHTFRRVSDTDRVRLADHQLALWLKYPNPDTTQFRLIEALLGDLGVYKRAYWLKVRYPGTFPGAEGRREVGLVRLPPECVTPKGGLLTSAFLLTDARGKKSELAPSEVVAFSGYNPLNPLCGLSPLETLHRVIAEEAAAVAHRESYFRNSSRHEGIIERPATAKKWDERQQKMFREQWQQRFAGAGNTGLIAVLEDGMQFKPAGWSPKDSKNIQGTKQRREITAAQYNVPQPSIGILDHATFSNIREQHKQLYQDSLGPTLEMVVQEIERQLLPECEDRDNVYIEFNIAAKLAGSFEEQSVAIRTLVGRPVMTPNEARARLNLPAIKDDPTADQIAPQQGGPADASARPAPKQIDDNTPDPEHEPEPDPERETAFTMETLTVQATRARQQASLAKVYPVQRSSVFFESIERWNRELAADLTPILGAEEAARVAVEHNVAYFIQLEALEVP